LDLESGGDYYENLCNNTYIHSLGLKFGLYSTPWICSYAGFIGGSSDGGEEMEKAIPESERSRPTQFFGGWPRGREAGLYRTGREWFFDNDVRQWAEWGVDFVKVDWNPITAEVTERIADSLSRCGRDIVLSLSNSAPLEAAPRLSKLAGMWRISGDIRDTWESIRKIGFEEFPMWLKYASPGHYNDPDMLQCGAIGVPNEVNTVYRESRLTREEQKTQFALWCICSAPLILSCDVAGMDDSTFEMLSNDTLISIDQDPHCAIPEIVPFAEDILLFRKELSGGKRAVAFFNLSDEARPVDASAEFRTSQRALDGWSQRPVRETSFRLAPHGSAVLLIG